MQVIADLQLHSKYARAVSQDMVVPEIARWAAKKGIDLVATGDWTHPLWFRELQANLKEVMSGLFALRGPVAHSSRPMSSSFDKLGTAGTRRDALRSLHPSPLFLLSTEVSCIYSQGGKGRRIHILVFSPSFETVEKINRELVRRGANLLSDGRPIMGLSSKDVAELVLSVDPTCLLIPAHAWTPWFSLYGSMSGFDSIEECFGEFSKYIYAIETGLSSDPAMNWRIPELENRNIVSFSDAHSPAKMGREATVFEIPDGKLSYEAIRKAIVSDNQKTQSNQGAREPETQKVRNSDTQTLRRSELSESSDPQISYTIEFYPEEGKYHYTGHRNCGVRQTPEETRRRGTTCHVCGRPLTVGVMHRVEELAGQRTADSVQQTTDEYGVRWINHPDGRRPKYVMMVPLLEILSEALSSGISSKKVDSEYEKLTTELGSEFKVLLETKPEEIERFSGPKIREAIMKVRGGDIFIDPGFDGVFGRVKIWPFDSAQGKPEKAPQDQLDLF